MTERERMILLLEKIKKKIRILDAIEERLIDMRGLVFKSFEYEILDDERQNIQLEVDKLYDEIKLLEKDSTVES